MPNVQGSGFGQQLSYAPIALQPDDGDFTNVAKYDAAETTRLSGSFDEVQDDAKVVGPSKAAVGCWKALKRDSWLLPLVHTEFWMSAAFSLIQPFYPILASSRGIEAWKYGFVFSFFKVFMLIGSIAAEKLINRITPTACYLFGQGGFFIFTILFGCLYWAPGGNVLLGLSMACVVLGGITNTFYLVSMFAVLTTRFPKHRGGIIACLEFLWGSGNMAGSAIGGALIDAWAYPLPYFVLGAITMLSFPVVVKFRSKLNQYNEAEECEDAPEQEGNIRSYYWLLTDPIFLADMVTLTMSWIILGFNEPTLEPSLENFNLTGTVLGSIYTVQFSSYSVGGFIAGTFSHYSLEPFYAMMGQLFTIVAYLVIGPAPFLPVSRTLALVYISQVFTGLGMSAQFVCGYCHALKRAVQRGYPDNIRTNGFISSIVFTFAVFGAMVTPPVAGYFVELYGYRRGSMLMFGLLVAWAPATVAMWVYSIRSGRKESRVRHYPSRPPNQLAMS